MADETKRRQVGVFHREGVAGRRCAVTLVEMLVVVVIIAILLWAVLTASSALISRSKIKNTEAVLTVVNEALTEFEREQKSNPTLTKNRAYKKRYGLFPPDELEVFTPNGIPGEGNPRTRAPGRAVMVPKPPYEAMTFYSDPSIPNHDATEHRDLAAMVVAIELFGDGSRSILDRLSDKNRTAGVVDDQGHPSQFLDKNRNQKWDGDDFQIRYVVDDWGNPLSYFAQRDFVAGNMKPNPSSNHPDWNEESTELVRLNRGKPIIMSYGPDGAKQLTKEAMGSDAEASLVGDLENKQDHIADNPFNADNIYLNAELKEKLFRGLE